MLSVEKPLVLDCYQLSSLIGHHKGIEKLTFGCTGMTSLRRPSIELKDTASSPAGPRGFLNNSSKIMLVVIYVRPILSSDYLVIGL